MWPIVPVSLVLLWIVASAASRGRGYLFFAAGLVLLSLALWAFARGRRDVLYRFVYVLLLAASLALAFEAALRLRPSLLRGRLANVAYSGYHWQPGGTYDRDDHRGPVLRPGVRRWMYWNGHWWYHRTGAAGWRGADVSQADAVFLGDSMIYGHGVEEGQTVAARYAQRAGVVAVNLGQQGTGQIQSLLALAHHAPRLRPRLVFASIHPTDVEDETRYYEDEELLRFAAAAPGGSYLPWARPRYRPRPWWDASTVWSRYLGLHLWCAGIAGTLARTMGPDSEATAYRPRDPFVPTPEDIRAPWPTDTNGLEPALAAERRAVLEMKRLCDRLGARLVVFDLGYPESFTRAAEALAREVGASYSDAGRQVLKQALAGERLYLADDGHWSAAGHDAVAEVLARDVRQGVTADR